MIVGIIQVRVGSSRLPGKALIKFNGKRIIEHIVARVKKSKLIDKIMLACPDKEEDNIFDELFKNDGHRKFSIHVYHGSENDVLDRYKLGIGLSDADHVVRITGDCPLIDPIIIDKVIELHLKQNNDYTDNTLSTTFPDGYDVTVFKASALYNSWKYADKNYQREHIGQYILENPIRFKIGEYKNKENMGHIRLTIDQIEDYNLLKVIFERLYEKNNYFGYDEVMELLKKEPELLKMNSNIIRDEGLIIIKKKEGLI